VPVSSTPVPGGRKASAVPTRQYQVGPPSVLPPSPPTQLPPLPVELADFQTPDMEEVQVHRAVLAALATLTKSDAKRQRVEAGRIVLDAFFLGRFSEYTDADPRKASPFLRFVESNQASLADIRWTSTALRGAIRTFQAWRTLPELLRDGLDADQLMELSRVRDPASRLQLAESALRQHWSMERLHDAIDAVTASVAAPPPPDTSIRELASLNRPPAGIGAPSGAEATRLIGRLERAVHELQSALVQVQALSHDNLSSAQKQRLLAALAQLQ
jgi:hypothetical protein